MPPVPRRTAAQRRIETSIDAELKILRSANLRQARLLDSLKKLLAELQNAEQVRSQAEKRLEQQRKDLSRNWGG